MQISDLKSHFIPHSGNDFSPKMLQKASMLGMLSLILISFLTANLQALLWQSSHWLVGAVLPAVIVDLTNTQRKDLALPTLSRNSVLDVAAQLKANDMAAGHYFSHNSPTGISPWHWFEKAGYVYTYAGENLAVYFTDSDAVMDAWMKSPTHRANIVGPNYKEIGVGTARGTYNGYDTVFVVQLFGSPAVKPVAVVIPPVIVSAPPVVVVNLPTKVIKKVVSTNTRSQATTTKMLAFATTTKPLVAGEETTNIENINRETATSSTEAKASPIIAKTDSSVNNPQTVINDSDYVAVYSDLAATSTNLAPAVLANWNILSISDISPLDVVATKPNTVLKFLYIIIGFWVSLALFASVMIAWREHRPVQTAYGVGLLLVMIGLFYIHITVTSGAFVL